VWLRQTIEQRPAVIAVNRFGHTESEGDGMRAEIAEAVVSGAVVLIAVRRSLLADLEAFLGAPPTPLPADAAAIADWAERTAALVAV
jgi:molybdate transport system ATP-binding protein